MTSAKWVDECTFCLRERFTRPVRIYPGYGEVVTLDLCLNCRLNWRDSEWACLETTVEHAPRRSP